MAYTNEYIYLKGKAKWFRHLTPDPEYAKYQHDLYLDDESLEKFKLLQERGVKNKLRKDEDGYYIKVGRPVGIKLKSGITQPLMPPIVLKADGITPVGNEMVGNGSDVITKCEVYEHRVPGGGRATAMRWLSSRIDNHIPYAKGDETAYEERQTRGLDSVEPRKPDPLF